MNFNYLFPSVVAQDFFDDHGKIEKNLVSYVMKLKKEIKSGGRNWVSKDTYTTLNEYDVLKDDEFKTINNFVMNSISNYINKLQINYDFNCVSGWFNVYDKNNFQEYHNHVTHTLSAIYFLKSDQNENAKLWFKRPFANRSNDIKSDNNKIFDERYYYKPIPGSIIVFPSSLEHCVEKENSNKTRITIAYNFNINNKSETQ